MKSLLQQLENNESLLLMYLADELPAQDRTEVEHMLAADAHLRGQLESMRLTLQSVNGAIAGADAAAAPLQAAPVLREVGRLMGRWHVQRLAHRMDKRDGAARTPRWPLVAAAVAAVAVGVSLFLANHADSGSQISRHGMPYPYTPPADTRPRYISTDDKLAMLNASMESSSALSHEDVDAITYLAAATLSHDQSQLDDFSDALNAAPGNGAN